MNIIKRIDEIKAINKVENFRVLDITVIDNDYYSVKCLYDNEIVILRMTVEMLEDTIFDIFGYAYQLCRQHFVDLPAERLEILEHI